MRAAIAASVSLTAARASRLGRRRFGDLEDLLDIGRDVDAAVADELAGDDEAQVLVARDLLRRRADVAGDLVLKFRKALLQRDALADFLRLIEAAERSIAAASERSTDSGS